MSADNAIFYRKVGDYWYAMHGFASNEYSDDDFVRLGAQFKSRGRCLAYAFEIARQYDPLEYGVCESTLENDQ